MLRHMEHEERKAAEVSNGIPLWARAGGFRLKGTVRWREVGEEERRGPSATRAEVVRGPCASLSFATTLPTGGRSLSNLSKYH